MEEKEFELKRDQVFGSLEAVKTVSELFAPASGKILEVNPALENDPELVNSDPYGSGWLIKIILAESEELDDLLEVDEYRKIID